MSLRTGTGTTQTGTVLTAPPISDVVRAALARLTVTVTTPADMAWLARQTGVSHSHLSRVLAGERPLTAELAARIEGVLGLEAGALGKAPARSTDWDNPVKWGDEGERTPQSPSPKDATSGDDRCDE